MEEKTNIKKSLKRIDDLLNQLKVCAFGKTLSNGIELPCNPTHFSNNVRRVFDEIRRLPKKFFSLNDGIEIFHCEREAIEDIAKETCVKNSDMERIVQYYYNNIENIVNNIHAKIENDHEIE